MSQLLTLRAKLMILMALVLGAAVLLLVGNNIRLTEKFRQTASEIRLAELAPLLSSTLAPHVFERDVATLQEELTSIVAASGVVQVSVEDANGETLWATEEAASTPPAGHAVRLTAPISLAGERIGTASVLLSTNTLDKAHDAAVTDSFLIGLSATLIGVLALGLFSYAVTRRLAALEAAAVAVTAGDLSVRAPASGRDEVAKVAVAFNTMLDKLATTRSQLEKEQTKLRLALEYADASYWEILPDGSAAPFRHDQILGFENLTASRKAWRERIHPDDLPRVTDLMARIRKKQIDTSEVEYRIRDRSGAYRWLLARGRRLKTMSGQPGSIIGLNVNITKRKSAEVALQQSQRRFETWVNSLPHAICMQDTHGRYLFANPTQAEHFGLPPDAVTGMTAETFFSPEAAQRMEAHDRQVVEEQRPIRVEVDVEFPDKKTRHLDVTKFPVFDPDGTVTAVGGISVDVTERHRAEKALADSERKFQTLIDNLPYQLFMKNMEGEYILASTAFCKAYADRVDCVVGKTSSDIYPAKTAAASQAADREVMARQHPLRYEIEFPSQDGSVQNLDVTKFPVFDSSGELIGLAGIAVDISKQRRAEKARQESDQRLRALIENLPFPISMNSLDGRYTLASPILAKNLGRDVDQILGKTTADLLPSDVAEEYTALEQEVRTTRRPITREITSQCQAEGSRILEVTKFPVFNADGALVGLAGFNLDITERRRSEEQLAQTQRLEMVGQLAGGIAHDFNNLLATIRGNFEILQERTKTDPATAKRLRAISRTVRRGTDLTERLLAIGRRQSLHTNKVNVDSLLDDMVELLPSALGSDISVEVEHDSDLWPICIDPGRLEDAVLNIALNAGAAMPSGGRLKISAANIQVSAGEEDHELTAGRYVLLSLDDTGTGIPSHIRPRILEPFFTTKSGGTGLGLSVVHGFLRQSGGALVIDSEEGHGTSVRMYLPCKSPCRAGNRPVKRPTNESRLALVVNDEQEMLAHTASQLRQLGYKTLVATDADSALALLAKHPETSLLVTDVILGNQVDGTALTRMEREQIRDLPVLFVSGHAAPADTDGGDGLTRFLRKPFGRDELAARLNALLSHSSTETSAQNA